VVIYFKPFRRTGGSMQAVRPLSPEVFMNPSAARRITVGRQTWTVYELPGSLPPHQTAVLVFERDKIARTVCNYPANWRELPDTELYALSSPR
jgi:hypothetical protein